MLTHYPLSIRSMPSSVREKPVDKRSRGCYSLSLCYQGEYHHYIIQLTSSGRLQVASANKSARANQFGSIAQVCARC